MKIKTPGKNTRFPTLLCFSLCLITTAFAQSSNPVEPQPSQPVQPAVISAETKPAEEIPKPKQTYEYIEPQNIVNFMQALQEAGKRGFKLDKITAMPSSEAYSSKGKAKGTILAGIVKFDGESRYDYNFFFAEGEDDPEQTLNNLSKNGWFFKDVISVYGGGDDTSLPIEDIFTNRLRKVPTFGNIYLLERSVDGKKSAPAYKLLKAGVRLGKSPTQKMQTLLDEAVVAGFIPVASYFSFSFKNLFSVDSFAGVVVEKSDDAKGFEYKFVRGNRNDGLREEIDAFSKQGFRIEKLNFNTGILVRETGSTAPVNYVWLETEEKTYVANLAAALAKNPVYISAGTNMPGTDDIYKNLLIVSDNQTKTAASEFRFVKMLPIIPKQFKKNPDEYLKTLEKPEVAFQKSMEEGFLPSDLYYSRKEGLTVIFERRKS